LTRQVLSVFGFVSVFLGCIALVIGLTSDRAVAFAGVSAVLGGVLLIAAEGVLTLLVEIRDRLPRD